MSEKNVCTVHGEKNANECRNLSAKKANAKGISNLTVDPDCTCEVGVTGPAGDPELLAKGSGAYEHPQTPAPAGPAIDCQ